MQVQNGNLVLEPGSFLYKLATVFQLSAPRNVCHLVRRCGFNILLGLVITCVLLFVLAVVLWFLFMAPAISIGHYLFHNDTLLNWGIDHLHIDKNPANQLVLALTVYGMLLVIAIAIWVSRTSAKERMRHLQHTVMEGLSDWVEDTLNPPEGAKISLLRLWIVSLHKRICLPITVPNEKGARHYEP